MNTLHDRGLTPPEPVDAPEAPLDSPWVMTAEGLRKTLRELEEDNPLMSCHVPALLLEALASRLEHYEQAIMFFGLDKKAPHAVQAWFVPCSIDIVNLEGEALAFDRLEEWENGTLQARWAEDAAEDAYLRNLEGQL